MLASCDCSTGGPQPRTDQKSGVSVGANTLTSSISSPSNVSPQRCEPVVSTDIASVNDCSHVPDNAKPIVKGVLTIDGSSVNCALLGAYILIMKDKDDDSNSIIRRFIHKDEASNGKLLLLSSFDVHFDDKEGKIRLFKAKKRISSSSASPLPSATTNVSLSNGAKPIKLLAVPSAAEYWCWKAAIVRALTLWPSSGVAPLFTDSEAPVESASASLLKFMTAVIRTWTFLSLSFPLSFLNTDDIDAFVHTFRQSSSGDLLRFDDASADCRQMISVAELNYASVLSVCLSDYQLPRFAVNFLTTLQQRHNLGEFVQRFTSLENKVQPVVKEAGSMFTNTELAHRYDASGSRRWRRTAHDVMTLRQALREWLSGSPAAPWPVLSTLSYKSFFTDLRRILRTHSGLSLSRAARPTCPGLNGIMNCGNTCYLSSVVQCLLHTPQLVRFLLVKAHRLYLAPGEDEEEITPVSSELAHLASAMWTATGTLDATSLLSVVQSRWGKKSFKKGEQQDAHEMLDALLQLLNSELGGSRVGIAPVGGRVSNSANGSNRKEAAVLPDSLSSGETEGEAEEHLIREWRDAYVRHGNDSCVTHLFSGQSVQRVGCPLCRGESYCCDSFTYIILPVSHATGLRQHKKTAAGMATCDADDNYDTEECTPVAVEECLDSYFLTEELEMPNDAKCERCKSTIPTATRTLALALAPPYLILCANRFKVDEQGRNAGKLYTPLVVRQHLTMGPWMRAAGLASIMTEYGSVVVCEADAAVSERAQYELYGVVCHMGDINHGHYISICRVGRHWSQFNDSVVTTVSSFSSWAEEHARDIYVLYYRSVAGWQ